MPVSAPASEEDDISNTNTDEVLIQGSADIFHKKRRHFSGKIGYLVLGVTLLLWGLATLIWPSFDLLMDERLRMRPGLPPYEFWKNPPDEVLIRVYIFNVTNPNEFLASNRTVKLRMHEIGPIVFMEKLTHSNVTFNANGTMTYVATRKAIFLPEMNRIDLNSTIIVPNWALLGIASYFYDQSFFVKLGLNLLIRTIKPEPFVKLTIDQFLWNFTDPLLDAAQRISPSMVPIRNLGILARIYTRFENTVTVFIGTNHTNKKFFLIDKYDGSNLVPNYDSSCLDRVAGSTEGVTYPQFLTKNDSLIYWRKTLCKNAVLNYQKTVSRYGLNAYRYTLPANTFDRTEPSDCYASKPTLLDGLSDVSKCHFGFPLASSFPHFLYSNSPALMGNVSGLRPNKHKHESFVIVEPTTGVPLESRARSQSNLVVRKLAGFNEIVAKFSNTVIPMFWLEYNQVGLPWYIASLVYFQVNVLPIFQWFFSAFLLFTSILFLFLYWNNFSRQREGKRALVSNKVLVFEKELFLNKG